MLISLKEDIESGFIRKSNEGNRQFNTYGLIFGIVIFNLYLLVDTKLVPEIIWFDAFIRLVVVTPIMFLYFPLRYLVLRLNPDAIVHEVLHGIGCMIVISSLMVIYAAAQTSAASEYYMGVTTVILFMNTVHRKPFALAMGATVGCLAVFIIGMHFVTVTSEVAKVPAIMCAVGVGVVSLFAAYRIEKVERHDYLASLREKNLIERIQKANLELHQLSSTDQLTGIHNRRSFDAAAAAPRSGCGGPRALIILDVDYFKNFNDSEGHVAGDECLRRIAGRLRDALRSDDGDWNFLARYGGEEFVILLDNCPTSIALAAAERLRIAVSEEAISHPNRPDGRNIVTVSLGVAVSFDASETTYDVLNRADAALYEAKRKGRDRLSIAAGHVSPPAFPAGFGGPEVKVAV